MRVAIWGCRGSVPTPGQETVQYGGNTSCVEVALADGTALILDAGTGIRQLGFDLLDRGVRQFHLLLTHLHLDHLEGLRFFAPLWDDAVTVDIWGPPSPVISLRERISRSFSPPLFPIDLRDIPARINFRDVPWRKWTINGALLDASLVVHPGPTLGYRIEAEGSRFAYLPDHEPALTGAIEELTLDWISGGAIAEDADLLIHDCQYFEDEYEERVGWGHSSVADAVAFSRAAGAKHLVLFHHEPLHSDDSLERLEERAQALAAPASIEATLAREGMVLEVA